MILLIGLVLSLFAFSSQVNDCGYFDNEKCISNDQYHANENVRLRQWQTPHPNSSSYQVSFQSYFALWGYADVKYTSSDRTEADVCIVTVHKNEAQVTMTFYFNLQPQSSPCRRFDESHRSPVNLTVTASDGTRLIIDPIVLIWNAQRLAQRPGDYRNGQKGAIVEIFGWPHDDVAKECELLGRAGYLGVKLLPVHEHLMSTEPISSTMNPWYFIYQPVSYRFNSRFGTSEQFLNLVKTCRSNGVRVYVDLIINHFTGRANDLYNHRQSEPVCTYWTNKTSSAPFDRQSPFYTHAYTYEVNENTHQQPSNEYPAAAMAPDDFHCERPLDRFDDLFTLNNGWLVGLTDIDTSKENVRERLAAYLVEMLSLGVSGFRIDAAKHISPEDLSAIFKKVQTKMGGRFPEDFLTWLEILSGAEASLLWDGPSWYGARFNSLLMNDLQSQDEVDKIKIFDGAYPRAPWENKAISSRRLVIQNDDHDSQSSNFFRDFGSRGCVLVKNCPIEQHRYYEMRLFEDPYDVNDRLTDWPIRILLSSFYHTYGEFGIPDGWSDCSTCKFNCDKCTQSVPYTAAYSADKCAYSGNEYTRVHRDIQIINAMRHWINLSPINGSDIDLYHCQ